MSDNGSLNKKPWLLPIVALAWPVLLWGSDRIFVIGQRDAEMANLRDEIVTLQTMLGEHSKLEVAVWANQRALDDKQQDTIEANRAERDAQIRAVGEKVVYNTARIDRDELTMTQLQDRIQVLEGLNNKDRPHR